MGVAGPRKRYFTSIARLTSMSGFPALRISITSRVMSRQIIQLKAWLVNVIAPPSLTDLM